jgi:alkanesulfonate monooxygenase SsuD/methylene tetrahydromethanopterin reductase-like flavin-dependent oxidoreductase (luciferase family)
MTADVHDRVGLLLGTLTPPEDIPRVSQLAESLGFDELWFAEDYFYTGGFSTASAALAVTRDITVGIGIVSALVRHPAVLAMEIASVARMFPGRVRPGIALGHPPAIRMLDLYPRSPLSAVRECLTVVRALLNGEEVAHAGETFSLSGVHLAHPVPNGVPLYQGGMAPKMVQLAGEIADGAIVPLMCSPSYVSWVREQLAIGQARHSTKAESTQSVTVFVFLSMDETVTTARDAVRETVAFYLYELSKVAALPEAYGIPELFKEVSAEGFEAVVDALDDDAWPDELMAVGDPAHCARRIDDYFRAGADAVVLYPMPATRSEQLIHAVGDELLPLIRQEGDLND